MSRLPGRNASPAEMISFHLNASAEQRAELARQIAERRAEDFARIALLPLITLDVPPAIGDDA